MRDSLTSREVEIVLAYADCDMNTSATAAVLKCHKSTVTRAFTRIFQQTGFNPSEFWDLHAIINELEKEDCGGRKD